MFDKKVDYQLHYKSLLKKNDSNIISEKSGEEENRNHLEFYPDSLQLEDKNQVNGIDLFLNNYLLLASSNLLMD